MRRASQTAIAAAADHACGRHAAEYGAGVRQSPDLNTLTTGVASLTSGQLGSGNQYPLQLAAAVLMSIPVAVVFFIFQRRIMSTSEGSEKG